LIERRRGELKFYRYFAALTAMVLFALLVAACGDNTATNTTAPQVATTAVSTTAKTTTVAGTTVAATTAVSTTVAATTAVSTTVAATTAASSSTVASGSVTEITFYFPTAVEGPITKTFDGYAADFMKANPDVKIKTVFAGGYADVLTKIQTEVKGGGATADVAILLSTDLYTLADNDLVVPLDSFIKDAKDGDTWLKDFYPAFLANSQANGKTWGIPFQRSTPVLFYNKDIFKEAGLDPEKAPATFKEMAETAQKLTKPDGSRWGIKIPSDGFPYWLYQGFPISNGQNVVGDAANKVTFNTPAALEGLKNFQSLVTDYKAMPKGVIVWGDTPKDFVSGNAAMIYHTTGSLTSILSQAKFSVGVGFLPAGSKGYGAPTGGGNLYIMKKSSAEKQKAAFRFIQFLTEPNRLADWTQVTGYVAPRKAAWETDTLKKLIADKPQYGVARDQLQYAQKELATHEGAQVQQILGKAVQSVITGDKDPQKALDDAQKEADKILADYKD
jgi:sn-glycerol 3-phosphate transport system substrate-binding protein